MHNRRIARPGVNPEPHAQVLLQRQQVINDSKALGLEFVRLIEDGVGIVVAAVGDGPSLVAAVVEHRPDVSVVDVRMPPTQRDEGLRAAIEAFVTLLWDGRTRLLTAVLAGFGRAIAEVKRA